jgi:hypothetical protein
LYASESCLQVFDKLAHGSVNLGDQIAFWWCVYRQINSRKTQYCSKSLTEEHLIIDNFFDYNTFNNYAQEFYLVFNQVFGQFPDATFKYYSRYQRGLITYHSLLYTRRQNSNSYSVCVQDKTNPMKLVTFYGQILFFFYIKNEPFFFFKRYFNSTHKFSSLVEPIEDVPNWKFYIDKYYEIIQHSTSQLIIFPCSFILYKCIFIRLDDRFSICTPIELETEHD